MLKDIITFLFFNLAMVSIAFIGMMNNSPESTMPLIFFSAAIVIVVNILVYVGKDEKDSCLFKGYYGYFFGRDDS